MTKTLFWFRRDLRLYDNAGLYHALKENKFVLPIFIFDQNILDSLLPNDRRVQFIFQTVHKLKEALQQKGSDLKVFYGQPTDIFEQLFQNESIQAIYTNHDYEPKALIRDEKIKKRCDQLGIQFKTFKDQTIFEKSEILTEAGKPYTVYTPYKNKWLAAMSDFYLKSYPVDLYEMNYLAVKKSEWSPLPTLESMKFKSQSLHFSDIKVLKSVLENYAEKRDFPSVKNGTSLLGLHLRFGTVSVRELAREGRRHSSVWLSELIWRDFFMQILWHFPFVENRSFKEQYEKIQWRKDASDFERWASGQTGYPMVDAGMRELNQTGHMHNRVRMVVASFLTKHLLHHWLDGERYFAQHLLDFDLSANNGNWQWAAGTGCDAAPYFRIFNPQTQFEKFDPQKEYVKKWVPEWGTTRYIRPMIDHSWARERALETFKRGLK